jgi:hypothetical protein
MLIHRRNLLENARPEIVLSGWKHDNSSEKLSFDVIENVGRGAAFHLNATAASRGSKGDRPQLRMKWLDIPILPSGRTANVRGEISLLWQNITSNPREYMLIDLNVVVICWDAQGRRHATRYSMAAYRLRPGESIAEDRMIAPSVMLTSRSTTSRSVGPSRRIYAMKQFAFRIPLLRRFVPPHKMPRD